MKRMAESVVNSNGKRPSEASQQSVESFAVCTNCSRLSTNLHNCDKCGSALSADNAALCYSAEPKRARQEATSSSRQPLSSSNHVPNGNSSSASTSEVGNISSDGVEKNSDDVNQSSGSHSEASSGPVPQALYMNLGRSATSAAAVSTTTSVTAATTTSSTDIQILPQALYVNVNNQVYPVGGAPTTQETETTSSLRGTTTTSSATRLTSVANTMAVTNLTGVQSPSDLMIVSSQVASSSVVNSAPESLPPPPPYTAVSPATVPSSQADVKVCLVANQIRIGTEKFIPATTVTFKSEGVLFSLKGHSNAPVLLNARAIVHCKANMSQPFPAFYFLLESSCIKQIQNIYKLSTHIFSENRNSVDRKRYISIFPNAVRADDAKGIKHVFKMMQQRFGRTANILDEIGPEAVLDFLYSETSSASDQSVDTNSHSSTQVLSSTSHTLSTMTNQVVNPPLPSLGPHRPSLLPTASQNLMAGSGGSASLSLAQAGLATSVAINQQRQGQTAVPRHAAPVSYMGGGPSMHASPAIAAPGTSPPTLIIPSDSAKWAAMQKNLVAGGVYQVQFQSNQQKRYCLWDGQRFVPCLVQDTGVQLWCTHVRIGSLKSVGGGAVSIKTEGAQAGISFSFSIKGTQNVYGSNKTLHIPLQYINNVQVCFERVPSMYIYPTNPFVEYIRSNCGLRRHEYNPESLDDRDRHIILFLKDVNADQRCALMSMKRGNRPFVSEMHTLNCLRILSKIKENSALVQCRISDFAGGVRQTQSAAPTSVNPVPVARNGSRPNNTTVVDDEDDDVIMTSEEIGIKCPYTQQVMKEPVRNKHCGHNYEKVAIMEFIRRRSGKGNAKCPYAGCGNAVPLSMQDLEDNWALRDHIRKTTSVT